MNWFSSILFMGVVISIPTGALAEVKPCAGLAPTFPSNYAEQASGLLQDVRNDAQQVAEQVVELKNLENDNDVSWGEHALQLARIQLEINEMNRRLCRLRVIQSVVEGRQRREISGIVPQIQAMAINSHDAIDHLKHHDGQLWEPSYQLCLRRLYDEAQAVTGTIDEAEQLSMLRTRESALEMRKLAGR